MKGAHTISRLGGLLVAALALAAMIAPTTARPTASPQTARLCHWKGFTGSAAALDAERAAAAGMIVLRKSGLVISTRTDSQPAPAAWCRSAAAGEAEQRALPEPGKDARRQEPGAAT